MAASDMNTELQPPKPGRFPGTRKAHWSFDNVRWISRSGRHRALVVLSALSLAGCSLSDLVRVDTPSDLITPDQVTTETGAMWLYGGVIKLVNAAYGGIYGDVVVSGILSDEFQDTSGNGERIDKRVLDASGKVSELYSRLQYVRTQGIQAAAALRMFPEKIPSPLVGRVYAIVGYAELLLAERFCSGVPLPTIPPGGGAITYTPGIPSPQLFERAIAHFDTAISLTGTDSLRFRRLAQVGKARALMGVGRYREARDVVADIPTDFVYHAEFSAADTNAVRPQTGGVIFTSSIGEGINGINWLGAQDPRVPIKDTVRGLVRSSKYRTTTSPIVIADGIEARLIEAEADLSEDNPRWLTTLNQLRQQVLNGVGTRALADTTDPGTTEARVNLLFYERAFWLYATGHRHGDMRRLVRQYQRVPSLVFPVGVYVPAKAMNAFPNYGEIVTLPLQETNNPNPYSKGCLDTNA